MKQITLKKNLTSGLIAFILGVVLYAAIPYCIKVKLQFSSSAFGPDEMPRIVAIIIIMCGLVLIGQSLILKKDETVTIEFGKELRVLIFVVLLIAYSILMPIAGFLVTTLVFVFASLFLMECRVPLYYLSAAILVAFIFVCFKYGLSVNLPTIIL